MTSPVSTGAMLSHVHQYVWLQDSMPNMDLAKKYEEDLEKLKQEQLEQVESIRVAIKVS